MLLVNFLASLEAHFDFEQSFESITLHERIILNKIQKEK